MASSGGVLWSAASQLAQRESMAIFSYRQPVRFPDVDHAGIAFFGVLLTYCHNAHEEWLKMLGSPLHTLLESGWGFPVVGVESTFFSPARHGDVIRLDLTIGRLGQSSLSLNYELFNETANWPVGTATITQVCTNLEEMRSMRVPDDFRQAVAEWERRGGV